MLGPLGQIHSDHHPDLGQALKQAEFIVRVPSSFKEVTLSYTPDSLKEIKGEQVFYLTRKEFLPDKDMEVWWK